jgi:predicted TIM-barrel fold metal-dependent hydrolase
MEDAGVDQVAMPDQGFVRVDCHAHVFTRACRLAPDRRYTPAYEAPLASYLAVLDRHGMSHGVLVQPSFLGTDNGYLLDCLGRAPERLRGVVVVTPEVSDRELDVMAAAGVVGIRLNLIGLEDPAEVARHCDRVLLRRIAARGWHVEIHATGAVFAAALDRALSSDAPVAVDHFGRPDPHVGAEDPGFRALLGLASHPQLWVKLSGPYRFAQDPGPFAAALFEAFGGERLLWGSDWPWTQHEAGHDYAACLRWLEGWVPDGEPRQCVLGANAARLYRLAGTGGSTTLVESAP